jgi:hypothetical protein
MLLMEKTSDGSSPHWYKYWLESIEAHIGKCMYSICGKMKQNRSEVNVIQPGGKKLYMKC